MDRSVWRKFDPDDVFDWLWVPSMGSSGGILCGVKSSRFNVISSSIGRIFVLANVYDKKFLKELCLVVVYGAAQDDEKEEFLAKLNEICVNMVLPTIIGGRFQHLTFFR